MKQLVGSVILAFGVLEVIKIYGKCMEIKGIMETVDKVGNEDVTIEVKLF